MAVVASNSVQVSFDASGHGSINTHKCTSIINQFDQEFSTTQEVMAKLNQESDAIGDILLIIQEVAEQTNLPTLYAAGNQWRGFAVVAHEARNMARRAQDSTEQIGAQIYTLQSEFRVVTNKMGTWLAVVSGKHHGKTKLRRIDLTRGRY
ncbi:methyl-accepting chemotaxis protein [Gilvimarinus agarilyticus]|uniref:methyl-accepting chemotaxis protein n=1 Tax=Gilvimarinus agarilyticus TaxID=679259 RepID=UPI00059F2090|nr:methyl-accepting chemotaxis protein [Gilvimarinus agarilyticus]